MHVVRVYVCMYVCCVRHLCFCVFFVLFVCLHACQSKTSVSPPGLASDHWPCAQVLRLGLALGVSGMGYVIMYVLRPAMKQEMLKPGFQTKNRLNGV